MARPEKKSAVVKNLDKIKKWAENGLTMAQIAEKLGVSESTLYKYKAELPELKDAIKNGRLKAVKEIENAMYKSAVGHTQKVKQYQKVKRCIYENGKKAKEWEEMVEYEIEVYYPPDNTAGIFLLKNWGKYSNEPATTELRKEELKLRKKQIENDLW